MSEAALTALTAGLMLLGLIGTLVPVVPDILLIWLAGLGYGLLVGWGQWGPWLFGLMTVFGLIGAGVDVILSSLGGLGLGLVGLIFFTPIGAVVGLLLGTFLVEFWRLGDARTAMRSSLGMGVGYGVSFVVKFLLGLAMVAAWVTWVISG